LLILLRFGANPSPVDCGIPPVLSLLEKLTEYSETSSYPQQLLTCFQILMLATPSIGMPFTVSVELIG
jgi:hypothetical protein